MGCNEERTTGVKCPICRQYIKYIASFRDIKLNSKLYMKMLNDWQIYSEKLICGCGTLIHFNNFIPNFEFYESDDFPRLYDEYLWAHGWFYNLMIDISESIKDVIG